MTWLLEEERPGKKRLALIPLTSEVAEGLSMCRTLLKGTDRLEGGTVGLGYENAHWMKESRNRYEKDGKDQDQQAKPPAREDKGYHKKRGRGKQT